MQAVSGWYVLCRPRCLVVSRLPSGRVAVVEDFFSAPHLFPDLDSAQRQKRHLNYLMASVGETDDWFTLEPGFTPPQDSPVTLLGRLPAEQPLYY